jgi:rare lipoprotein A
MHMSAETTAVRFRWMFGMVGLVQAKGEGTQRAAWLAISLIPLAVCMMLTDTAIAASINTEAASPQRSTPPVARPATATAPTRAPIAAPRPTSTSPAPNRAGDGVPDQSWGGPRLNTPVAAIPHAQVRPATVPVLGREGAAATAPAAPAATAIARPATPSAPASTTRQISITASEPALTSIVRPQDVASFQKIGAPYQVAGTWYVPAHEPNYDETGVASWYGADFQGKPTANGEIFDMNVVTGAHPTLPIPSLVEVTNLTNGRSVVVRINDRGPFVGNRLIDLSARGADLLGFRQQGHTNVRVRYVGPANSEPMVTAQNISTGQASVIAQAPAKAGPAFVQVGAFVQRENAERLAQQAGGMGPVRVVEAAQADGNAIYRVVMGPVSSRVEADAKALELSTSGFTGARVMASLN